MDVQQHCKDSNVTLKSTYKGPSIPVDVVCNECGLRFPVVISGSTKISCPACSYVETANFLEAEVVKMPLFEESMADEVVVEKTEEVDEDY